jgi:hypothetical protein
VRQLVVVMARQPDDRLLPNHSQHPVTGVFVTPPERCLASRGGPPAPCPVAACKLHALLPESRTPVTPCSHGPTMPPWTVRIDWGWPDWDWVMGDAIAGSPWSDYPVAALDNGGNESKAHAAESRIESREVEGECRVSIGGWRLEVVVPGQSWVEGE